MKRNRRMMKMMVHTEQEEVCDIIPWSRQTNQAHTYED